MATAARTAIDYVADQLDTFAERPLCRVDSLVFSWLCYVNVPTDLLAARTWDGVPLRDLYRAEWFEGMFKSVFDPEGCQRMMAALAASPRFRDVRVCNYVEELSDAMSAEQQFSATTYRLADDARVVAFRGTDNSLVGWKEDFNMAFQEAIPSQTSALAYLGQVAAGSMGDLWVCGHSKGGNLAAYAAVMCDDAVRVRLRGVFSHDGPGFTEETMADARWADAPALVNKTIPESSLVGMLFERQENAFDVVCSTNSGILQHAPLSWEVDGCDFVLASGIDWMSERFDAAVNEWVAGMTRDERERFVDTVFDVFAASGVQTFGQIADGWQQTVPKMLAALGELEPHDRELLVRAVEDVVRFLASGKAAEKSQELAAAGDAAGEDVAGGAPADGRPSLSDDVAHWFDDVSGRIRALAKR